MTAKRDTIDTTFDFQTDAGGRDADTYSPTLRRYHRLLWSKKLPGGAVFTLKESVPGSYLHHQSHLGTFSLASDSVIPTFTYWVSMERIIARFSERENERFRRIAYSIGGSIVFPGNCVGGKQTINGARGFNRRIADRLDLTLECIRRHYARQESPLGQVLARYGDFFALFRDFEGYVNFFLLQDLTSQDGAAVRFFLPFDDFTSSGRPRDVDAYVEYRRRAIAFVNARNSRIKLYADACL